MPQYVVNRIAEFLNDQSKPIKGTQVAILGIAYKGDVDDPRESRSFALMMLLYARGATLSYNDPHVPVLPKVRHTRACQRLRSQELTPEYLAAQDCALIATDHSADDYDFILEHSKFVVDGRNATKHVIKGARRFAERSCRESLARHG